MSFDLRPVSLQAGRLVRRFESQDEVVLEIMQRPSGWRFGFPGLATFDADSDGRIICQPLPGVPLFTVRHLLIDQVLPHYLVASRARTVLHASSVGVQTGGSARAVVFLGPSGAGKSTTAAGCVAAGAGLLADDFALLDFSGPHPALVPAGVGVRLWSDVACRIDITAPRLPIGVGIDKKRILLGELAHGEQDHESAVEIAALVWLGPQGVRNDGISIESTGLALAVTRVIDQSFRPCAGLPDEDRRSLDRAAQLVESVPVLEVSLPSQLDDLAFNCGLLLEQLASAAERRERHPA